MLQNVKLIKSAVKHIVKSVLALFLVIVTATLTEEMDGAAWECPPCQPGATNACCQKTTHLPYEEFFKKCRYLVNGVVLNLEFSVDVDDGSSLHYKIESDAEDLQGLHLDNACIPRLPAQRNVSSVALRSFPPPQGTYADALLALNVKVRDRFELYNNNHLIAKPLRADHFQGLKTLQQVYMRSPGSFLPANIFTPLTALTELRLSGVLLKKDFLMTLPTSLKSLELANCSVSWLPAGVMSRLRSLTRLTLRKLPLESPPALDTAPSLTEVSLLYYSRKRMPPLHKLINATIWISKLEDIRLPGGCGSLQSLTVKDAPVTSLPAAWLTVTDGHGECCKLKTLELSLLKRLESVHERALHGACFLTELELSGCQQLETLPVGLMQPLTNLKKLVLKSTSLKTLPGGILAPLMSMQWLDLSGNELTARALEDALECTLPALTTLEAGYNRLFDLCPPASVAHTPNETSTTPLDAPVVNAQVSNQTSTLPHSRPRAYLRVIPVVVRGSTGEVERYALLDNGSSATVIDSEVPAKIGAEESHKEPIRIDGVGVSSLSSLQRLSLAGASITRVCPQWRRHLVNLRELNLRANKITEITLEDMQWVRAANVTVVVDVRENPILRVTLSESQYTHLSGSRAAHNVTVTMMADHVAVGCDCSVYWMARAQREGLLPANIDSITCVGHDGIVTLLKSVDLHDMVCKRSECSAGCSCDWWPPGDTMVVSCATVSNGDRYNDSTMWPSLQAVSAKQIELDLSNTNMSRVPLTPLPKRVQRLDVSNNALSDVTTLLALDGVKLRLQHNALLCECTQLRELHRRRHQIQDFDNVTCEDGSLMTSHDPPQLCGYEVVAAVGLAVGLVLLVVGGWVGARRVIAARSEKHLHQLLAEAPYAYDGFLVFTHKDWWFAQRVMSALESDRGLRLCVHDRDWAPGEWVPAAIERSVVRSRRTLAIVSGHMARSQWACVELQQAAARAQAGRGLGPVLVLLGPVPREMRRHVRRHQSLRSTDRRLWDKLHRLLAAPNNVTAHPPIRHVRGVINAEETGANRFSE